jgi:preprotein translocase subunit SecF
VSGAHKTSFDLKVIPHRKLWFAISAAMMVPAIIFLLMGGLKPGLDFTGGSMLELAFKKVPAVSDMRTELQSFDKERFSDVVVTKLQNPDSSEYISIRSKPIDNNEQVKVFEALKGKFGEFEVQRVEVVGPTIGAELTQKATLSTLVVMAVIVIYLTFRFKFDYALCAIIALIHDVVLVLGSFAALGYFMGVEVDSLFVTALLTVAGFSVHDTIVTYDRIRENAGDMGRGKTFEEVANDSINQTAVRSLNTSITTMFPLFCLTVLGGETIRYFALAMFIGIVLGTFSSIFLASPLLVVVRQMTDSSYRKKTA